MTDLFHEPLERVEYRLALRLQHSLLERRLSGDCGDVLLTLEHEEVITVGRRRDARQNIVAAGGVPVVEVERGGDVTWHGPGQLVGYPVLLLQDSERDVHLVLRRLEDAVIGVARAMGVEGVRRPGYTGVWTASEGRLVKIASLGVALKGWVTFHGFALNVDCDLASFARINPCGLESGVMASIASVGGRVLARHELHELAGSEVARVFGRRHVGGARVCAPESV
jgi:lipoate-protein ligase B